jgi:NAD(P)H-quinone oxidoreductase subunit 5
MPDDLKFLLTTLSYLILLAPLCLVVLLGLASLFDKPLGERAISFSIQVAIWIGLVSSVIFLGVMLTANLRKVPIELGNWVDVANAHEHAHQTQPSGHEYHYHFSIKFIFDRLSVPFVILSYVLCGTIGAFATRYMHREPGFNRFFTLFTIFLLGMIVTSLAGTIETLFAGWELVGLSSAMLVAFFHERTSPVRNGLRVWSIYRISDAALLTTAVVLHHLKGEGDFIQLLGDASWPDQHALVKHGLSQFQVLATGCLLIVAAAGKSALVPFSGWLPRAMEGPTPSSAVFYGALSVHLGAFLLLRTSPLIDQSLILGLIVITIGLLTAFAASLFGRVQTDIKSALSFASLTQVGIIVAEVGGSCALLNLAGEGSDSWLATIGTGLRYFSLIHLLGHACLRTLQFVRAPTLLHDYRLMENALGERISNRVTQAQIQSNRRQLWWYRFALERGYLDAILKDYIVMPLLRVWGHFERWEQQWLNWLSGTIEINEKERHHSSPVEDNL